MSTEATEAAVTKNFTRGNERLASLLSDRDIADRVERIEAETAQMDKFYADGLVKVRKAAELTQLEVAQQLGVGQAVVSRLERRPDMMLSTLARYLEAVGAVNVDLIVYFGDNEITLSLERLIGREAAKSNRELSESAHPQDKTTVARHVVPNAEGGWDVLAEGAVRRSAHSATQVEAIGRARDIVRNAGGGEVVIHGKDGGIRGTDTVPRRRASKEIPE